jgi:hypothetical protein
MALRIAYALPDVSTPLVAETLDHLLGNAVYEIAEMTVHDAFGLHKDFYIQLYHSRDLRQSRLLDEIDSNGHAKVYYTHNNIRRFWMVTRNE